MVRKSVKQCEGRLHDGWQVAVPEQPGDAAIPALGSLSRLRMPAAFISVAAVVMTPPLIASNPARCRGDGSQESFCGRARTCPGHGLGSVRLPIHPGRILPGISAGKFGLRLLGCPGRRGQGSRPEAAGLIPLPCAGKALSHPPGSGRGVRTCFVLAKVRVPAGPSRYRPGGVNVGGCARERPQNAAKAGHKPSRLLLGLFLAWISCFR